MCFEIIAKLSCRPDGDVPVEFEAQQIIIACDNVICLTANCTRQHRKVVWIVNGISWYYGWLDPFNHCPKVA